MTSATSETLTIGPQPGPQTDFLATEADIAIYGGAAGGGKSYGLLLEPARHLENGLFGGVIFRRTTTQIRNQGSLWDESIKLYTMLGGKPTDSKLSWRFPSGMKMKFAHLEYDSTVVGYQGAQIPFIGFDELTHFTENQFFYMMSRNRSTSGVPGYIRATCNPDVDSWVAKLIEWWIDQETGFPIPERSGVLRWFIRVNGTLIWADSRQELLDKYGADELPKSLTFIPSKVSDNKILLEKDPAYLSNLKALNSVERARLLDGNWKIRAQAGDYFQRKWFEIIDVLPATGKMLTIRYWDRAATKPSAENKDPDWTRGVKISKYRDGTFVIEHVASTRDTPGKVEELVSNTAKQDGYGVMIGIEEDPGSAGKADAATYVKLLAGFRVRKCRPTKDKVTRAKGFSSQCQYGNVKLLRGSWNDEFLSELEAFPSEKVHDDQVDGSSGGFNVLVGRASMLDVTK